MTEFLIIPFAVAIIASLICGAFGSFILWNRASYLGDGLSHSMILGFALSSIFQTNLLLANAVLITFFLLINHYLSSLQIFKQDVAIAIGTYICLAIAILLKDYNNSISFNSYFFGEILTANKADLLLLMALLFFSFLYLFFTYKKLLLISINHQLAMVQKIRVSFYKNSLMLIFATIIATFSQIIGVFFLTAMLVIPAAISRLIAKSPIEMIIISIIISFFSVILAFSVAIKYNLNLIAVNILILCVLLFCLAKIKKKNCYL